MHACVCTVRTRERLIFSCFGRVSLLMFATAGLHVLLKLVAEGSIHLYLYFSSTKPSSVIIGRVGTYCCKRGKARKCLQGAEQRVLLLRGLCVADTGSVNRRPPPSTTYIHGDTAITACEKEITDNVLWLQQHKPVVIIH